MQKFFITGSSQGLGKSLVELILQRENVRVTGISRTNSIQHDKFQHIPVDFSDIGGFRSSLKKIFTDIDGFDKLVLVNNAGYLGDIKYFGEVEDNDLVDIYNINVIAPAILMNAFIRSTRFVDAEKIIVNISSGAGRHPYDGWGGYCSSKSAIDMMSLVADQENQNRNSDYKIFAIAPGPVETNMQKQVRRTSSIDFSQIKKFQDLHKNEKMPSANVTAMKLISFIDKADQFGEVIQDIRKINFT